MSAGWVENARARLEASHAAMVRQRAKGTSAETILRVRSDLFDALLVEAWTACGLHARDTALLATGGYGRRALYPHSDIDVLVLAAKTDAALDADVQRFIALLWEARVMASHTLQTPVSLAQLAAGDISTFTAVMDARVLAGPCWASEAVSAVTADGALYPPRRFYEEKVKELRARHARFSETTDSLEPNLKEGPGGLRDLQTLRWMAMRIFGARTPAELTARGLVGADELATLERCAEVLRGLRLDLHLITPRREDRLRFEHQRTLAAQRLGQAEASNADVEALMQGYYRSAALVRRIGERLLQRFAEHLQPPVATRAISTEFELAGDWLLARSTAWPDGDPAAVLRLFDVWAGLEPGTRLHSRTARALAEGLELIPAFDAASAHMRVKFLALLRGPNAIETLLRMGRSGVLARFIPAFARITGRMQFDLFHVFTVDQHTLALLENFAHFRDGSDTERFSHAHAVWQRLKRHDLLLLAGLFHDIAKGRGGDHSQLGAVDAREFCLGVGLPAHDAALVEWLVREHLMMSLTAQKEDIGESQVVQAFARRVADRERLDHLYLLTCADIAATSPKLWNAWKDRLLGDLHTAARLALRRGLEHPVAADERIAQARDATRTWLELHGLPVDGMAWLPAESWLRADADQLQWLSRVLHGMQAGETRVEARALGARRDALELMVHAPDRHGMFAAMVATLDRIGLDVVQARLLDAPGRQVIDTFQLSPRDSRRPVTAREVERRVRDALAGALERIRPARHARPTQLRAFRIAPQVQYDPIGEQTLLSVVGLDRPGLLAELAHALRQANLRVHDARIATFGERAEDVFRITTLQGEALETDACDALAAILIPILSGAST